MALQSKNLNNVEAVKKCESVNFKTPVLEILFRKVSIDFRRRLRGDLCLYLRDYSCKLQLEIRVVNYVVNCSNCKAINDAVASSTCNHHHCCCDLF